MKKIPVIVGIGGMNSAGRSSGFHGYKRMVCDALSAKEMEATWKDLAYRMKLNPGSSLSKNDIDYIKQGTLIRKITSFDPENVLCHHKARMGGDNENCSFIIKKAKLPRLLPENWMLHFYLYCGLKFI